MNAGPRFFIIAGEPSGDRLGGGLIAALGEATGGRAVFEGIGGPAMAAAGLQSRFDMAELSVMGVSEVLPRLPTLLRRIRETGEAVGAMAPDALITIDSPDFCLRVAHRARRRRPGLRTIHYVAPSVWAWRPGRAAKMARVIDHVLALLPFEPPYMAAAGMGCDAVGHPIAALPVVEKAAVAAFRARLGLAPGARLLAVLPGSRMGEVSRLGPIFRSVMARLRADDPGLQAVLPAAHAVAGPVREIFGTTAHILDPLGQDEAAAEADKRTALAAADAALAASGTVALELAAAGTPMVSAYRASALTTALVRRLALIDTANLVNIISESRAVPEFLGEACRPETVAPAVADLLAGGPAAAAQRSVFGPVMAALGRGGADPNHRAAAAVLRVLSQTPTR